MGAFLDSLDIANRALDHLGLPYILAVDEASDRNAVLSAAYDKLREAELEGHVWKFAKRKVYLRPVSAASRLLAPAAWNVDETYLPGAIVSDANGDLWISWTADNYGNEPGVTDAWDSYFGPLSIDPWTSGVSYNAGELVYKAATYPGSFAVFLSTATGNSDNPDTTTAWDATVTYDLNDRVFSGGSIWRSLIPVNLNITPVQPPNDYSAAVTYNIGDGAVASDGFVYTALNNTTINIDPMDDDGSFWTRGAAAAWSADPGQYSASPKWLPIFANLKNIGNDRLYVAPGVGGAVNVFRVPSGLMRSARIGYRFRQAPNDIEPHGDYLTSADAILLIEFVANVKNVPKMDAMFCEMLALRLAQGTCKKLTGSDSAKAALATEYQHWANTASGVNAIEMGPEEPDEDEYITVRTGGSGGYSSAATNWWGNG